MEARRRELAAKFLAGTIADVERSELFMLQDFTAIGLGSFEPKIPEMVEEVAEVPEQPGFFRKAIQWIKGRIWR